MDRDIIEWNTLEYELHEKSADWYWILGIVVVVGTLIAIVFGNVLFALLVLLGGFLLGLYASKHPDRLECYVDRRGVHVNNVSYLHKDIDTFWIDESRVNKVKLLLTMKNRLAIQVAVPLSDDVDLDYLHEYLRNYVHEEEQAESLAEQIIEWLKL